MVVSSSTQRAKKKLPIPPFSIKNRSKLDRNSIERPSEVGQKNQKNQTNNSMNIIDSGGSRATPLSHGKQCKYTDVHRAT